MNKQKAVRLILCAVMCVVLTFGLAPVPIAHAASLTVNTLLDNTTNGDGLCTLREAITAANNNRNYNDCMATGYGNDMITFSVSGTITLGSHLPNITDVAGLIIIGPAGSITISGNNAVGIFEVNNNSVLNLQNLTLSNANAPAGGGIYNFGAVSVTNCTFTNNNATQGAGIQNSGVGTATLTVINSTFANNTAAVGGGIINFSILTVVNSTFSGNSANQGGGLFTTNSDSVSVANSTFSNNSALDGAGIYAYGGMAVVANSTFFGNTGTASDGAGINVGGTVTITNSTFSGNRWGVYSNGNATLRNTIITNSTAVNCGTSIVGAIANGGNNIDDGSTCGWGASNGSLSSTNPQLGVLAHNGGPTQMMALLAGSPAINGVIYAAPNGCPATDQRGYSRSGACDIGAYEYEGIPPRYIYLPLILR